MKEDFLLPMPVESNRDILIFKFSSGKKLVIGCDSAGGIGPKPLDKIKVDGYTLGKFTARVTLMEVLSTGAIPFCIIDNLSVELNPTGLEILEGIKDEAKIAGLDPKLAITGGTEKNFLVEQTGIGITVIGFSKKERLRIGCSKPDDIVVAIGRPCVGNEVIPGEEKGANANINDIQKLLDCSFVNEIIPVGSEGVLHEIQVLAKSSKLEYKLSNYPEMNLRKSAGPSTVILATMDKSKLSRFRSVIEKPISVVAYLTQ